MLPSILYHLAKPLPAAVKAVVSSGWSRDRGKYGPHRALDIPVPVGTPVLAIADGTVIRANPTNNQDAGIFVGIEHEGGVISRQMHLSRLDVKLGDHVRQGQQVGLSGNTGNSAGPHLHIDLSVPLSAVADVIRVAGQPSVGWGTSSVGPWYQAPYGYKIPAEPWIPVDGLSARTVADAKAAGVRITPLRAAGGIVLALGAAALIAFLVARR